MADSEFTSFEDALGDLSLDEEDLKRLISAGEIRAFRDGSKMRLRADDVARVANDLGVSGKIGEDDAGEVLEVEEVLFSEAAPDDEGMVTTQLSEEETLLDDDVEVVPMGSDRGGVAGGSRKPRSTRSPRAAAAADEEEESAGVRFAAIATTALMVWGLAFVIGMATGTSNGLTDPIVGMFSSSE